jgi:hypothetical protein
MRAMSGLPPMVQQQIDALGLSTVERSRIAGIGFA